MKYSVWHPTPEVNSIEEVIEVILREKDNFSICDNGTGEVIFSIENGKVGVCDEQVIKGLIEYASKRGATTAPTEPPHKAKAVKIERIPDCGFELYNYDKNCLPSVNTTEDPDCASHLRVWTDAGVEKVHKHWENYGNSWSTVNELDPVYKPGKYEYDGNCYRSIDQFPWEKDAE